jgi:hypothetical protein
MKMANNQRRTIYGLATELGIYEKNNPNDSLHDMVAAITGKSSIGDLTFTDANQVIGGLRKLKNGTDPLPVKTHKEESSLKYRPGMITPEQRNKIWAYMYNLVEYDINPSKVTIGTRLCKIIEKYLHVTAVKKDPFRFVTFEKAGILIEVMKKMIRYEKSRSRSQESLK